MKSICINNILSNSNKYIYAKLKHNLAYKIIVEVRKLDFSFQESSSYKNKLEITSTSIASLLEEKEANNYRKSSNIVIK